MSEKTEAAKKETSQDKGATMDMNPKAEKFSAMLKTNKIDNVFEVIEAKNQQGQKDDLETIIYRSTMEIAGQRLPVLIIVDKSVFVVIRTFVSNKSLEDDAARARVERYIDELNGNYKVFKYYIKDGSLILDMCYPTSDKGFEPDLIRVLVDLAVKHLTETYPTLMEKIWGKQKAA